MATRTSNLKRDVQHLQAQTLAGLVESGFLMAAADGQISEQEISVLVQLITGFTDGLASNDEVEKLVMACATALDKDGWEARLQVVAGHLSTKPLRRYGLLAAALVLVSDDQADDREIELYSDMAEAFGLSEDQANDVLDEAEGLAYGDEDDL